MSGQFDVLAGGEEQFRLFCQREIPTVTPSSPVWARDESNSAAQITTRAVPFMVVELSRETVQRNGLEQVR